jgi:hypothetical protein
MPTSEPKSVTYLSGTSEALGVGWDVMKVVYKREDAGVMRIANSFVIARDAGGKIIRQTDIDRWEVVSDEETIRGFQQCFDERDRLAAEKAANMDEAKDPCKCGHAFSSHTRDIRETNTMQVDDALLDKKEYDIFSDKPAGESGCTECACPRWKPAGYGNS